MNPRFSIIIPIFNVEKYLNRCIDSVIEQTFKNFEIILINDGSTDKSIEICEEYAEKHNKIKIINKKNGGLSDARNTGLNFARGDYIIFLDSDDYIESRACEDLNKYCELNSDVIMGNARRISNDKISYMNHTTPENLHSVFTGQEALIHEFKNKSMHMAACMNIYRREFLIENKLYFKVGILHEDENWTPKVFIKAKQVQISNVCFYNYIIRNNSITNKKDKTKNAIDLISTCYELSCLYDNLESNVLKEILNDYLVTLYLHAFYSGKLYRKEFRNHIDKSFLINRSVSKKNIMKVKLFNSNIMLYYIVNLSLKSLSVLNK